MFNDLKQGRTFVFLDLSNIYHAQFTMGWHFNVNKLFDNLDKDKLITKTLLFGAYDENCQSQKKRVDAIQEQYKDKENFYIYFKTIRLKGDKFKGNLDSELVCEALYQIQNFDTMILFSGDGDFAYVLEKLLNNNKKVFIMSVSAFTGAELYELERKINDESKFKIFDINSSEASTVKFLKQIIRGRLVIYPELNRYYKELEQSGREKNIQLIQDLIDGKFMNLKLFETEEDSELAVLFKLKNRNNEYIFPMIKKWKKEDKERLISYIKTL